MSLFISVPLTILGNYIIIYLYRKRINGDSKIGYVFFLLGIILIALFGEKAISKILNTYGVYGNVEIISLPILAALEYFVYKTVIKYGPEESVIKVKPLRKRFRKVHIEKGDGKAPHIIPILIKASIKSRQACNPDYEIMDWNFSFNIVCKESGVLKYGNIYKLDEEEYNWVCERITYDHKDCLPEKYKITFVLCELKGMNVDLKKYNLSDGIIYTKEMEKIINYYGLVFRPIITDENNNIVCSEWIG